MTSSSRTEITVARPGAPLRSSRPVTASFLRRPVTVDDLSAVAELLTASDVAVLGRTDFTVTELEGDLRNENMEHQGWYDDAGALVAYGWVQRIGALYHLYNELELESSKVTGRLG